MNTDYPTATFYDPTSSSTGVNLSQLFILPTFAKAFGERHAIGFSPIIAYQMFEIEGALSFRLFSSDPSKLSGNGTDDSAGYGFKVGYLGRLTEDFSVGVSYQSEVSMDEFSDYAGLFAEQGGFDVPSSWTAGVAFEVGERGVLLLDYQEIKYSDSASVSNPFLPNLLNARLGDDRGAGFGWQDMEVIKVAYQWTIGDWTWRLGASTTDQPIPESEVLFNILAPGVMEDHYTVGFTRTMASGNELSFSLMHAPSVSVSGPNPLEAPGAQSIELQMDQWDLEIGYSWGF
jgi:long-chain fatty acid transport protein